MGLNVHTTVLPLQLNLLVPERLLLLRRRLILILVRTVLSILFIECAIIGITFLIGRLILEQHFRTTIEESVNISRGFSKNNKEIRNINEELAMLDTLRKQAVATSDVYGTILALTPPGVSYQSMTLDIEGKQLHIRGVAETRTNLNALQHALSTTPLIQKLNAPLSNLFTKVRVPFEFSGTLTYEHLTAPIFFAPTVSTSSSTPL